MSDQDGGSWSLQDEQAFLALLDEESARESVLGGSPATVGTTAGGSWQKWSRSCSHRLDEVPMSDGTILHASDFYSKNHSVIAPDIGFYLDRSWHPEVFAYMVEWEDFGLPRADVPVILRYARRALEHARAGEIVEIACLGSHGRTGTFLAICDLLTMDLPDADIAIHNVRLNHCHKAIETEEQEWYVECIAAMMTDSELPMHPRELRAKKLASSNKNHSKKGGKKKRNRKR